MAKKISDEKLKSWLGELASAGKLYGPDAKKMRWGKVDSVENLGNAFEIKTSPKEVFLPQDQTMFKYDLTDPAGTFAEIVPHPPEGAVLWGLRPCDAKALMLIHRVYNEGSYKDVYFNSLWEGMIKIAVGCTNPLSTCFCTSFEGGNPFGTDGVDVLATKIDGQWIFEPVTERGEKLIANFDDATDEDNETLKRVKQAAIEKVDSTVPTVIAEKLWEKFGDEDFWFDLGATCLGCGICTFVCPSCYCFDINEEQIDRRVRRYRTWDSCQFALFTLEASGHNPRPTQLQRIRQRMMHKLSFFAKRYDGTQLCVGCGRCISACPTSIDIRDVARRAMA